MDHGGIAGVTVADIQIFKGDRWVINGQVNFGQVGRTLAKDGAWVDGVGVAAGVLIV